MRYDGAVPSDPPERPENLTGPTTPGTRWWIAVARGRSMLPTLADGDRLLVRSGCRGAAAGRMGVVRLPGGRPISVKRLARREGSNWWVERDNPDEGVDSWQVGAIPDDDLLGVVVARLWPRPRRL
jgi:phage repressor protein C with HTH and peptisase S24 domain